MAKKLNDQETSKGVTPTELSNLVNITLMAKPNKGVIFGSFVNNIDKPKDFIIHCLKNITGVGSDFYNEVKELCNEKSNALLDEEIRNAENNIKANQKILEMLLKQKEKGV